VQPAADSAPVQAGRPSLAEALKRLADDPTTPPLVATWLRCLANGDQAEAQPARDDRPQRPPPR
jgi:hypothetical protein